MTSFEKIDSYRIEKGWSGAKLIREIGLKSRGVYTQWRKGLQEPSPENLKKMAELFGISVFDLLGDKENENPATDGDGYDIKHKEFNELLDLCNPAEQDIVIDFLKTLVHRRSVQGELPKSD